MYLDCFFRAFDFVARAQRIKTFGPRCVAARAVWIPRGREIFQIAAPWRLLWTFALSLLCLSRCGTLPKEMICSLLAFDFLF